MIAGSGCKRRSNDELFCCWDWGGGSEGRMFIDCEASDDKDGGHEGIVARPDELRLILGILLLAALLLLVRLFELLILS